MDADYTDPTIAAMREVWLCGHCGAENTPRQDICMWCGAELDAVGWIVRGAYADGYADACDTYAETYDPAEWGDWDTDEELPCLHADGCPGHRRCLVCIDYEEGKE